MQQQQKVNASSDNKWIEIKQSDIAGFGDVYNQRAGPIEEMKKIVIQNGWTSVTITKNGVAFFKKFHYDLNENHVEYN